MKGIGGGIISACSIFIGILGTAIGSWVAKCKKITAVSDNQDVQDGQTEVRIEEEQDDDLYTNEDNDQALPIEAEVPGPLIVL